LLQERRQAEAIRINERGNKESSLFIKGGFSD